MLVSKINSIYEQHNLTRICQGDILRDFKFTITHEDEVLEIELPYIVIISQDCDLENGVMYQNYSNIFNKSAEASEKFNQLLPNIIFIPAFPAEVAREGNHLKELFNIEVDRINSTNWKNIKNNQIERYHFLPNYLEYQVPELLLDFKIYFTLPINNFLNDNYNKSYLITLNELFREKLSQRFAYYLNRIGLPTTEQ